jgi:hypothetical protein
MFANLAQQLNTTPQALGQTLHSIAQDAQGDSTTAVADLQSAFPDLASNPTLLSQLTNLALHPHHHHDAGGTDEAALQAQPQPISAPLTSLDPSQT